VSVQSNVAMTGQGAVSSESSMSKQCDEAQGSRAGMAAWEAKWKGASYRLGIDMSRRLRTKRIICSWDGIAMMYKIGTK